MPIIVQAQCACGMTIRLKTETFNEAKALLAVCWQPEHHSNCGSDALYETKPTARP